MVTIPILIVTHEKIGQDLLDSAQSILGEQPQVFAISIPSTDSLGTAITRIKTLRTTLISSANTLVLVDLLGSTPENAAISALKGSCFKIVSGVNLPMLLSVFEHRSRGTTLTYLAQKALIDGRRHMLIRDGS